MKTEYYNAPPTFQTPLQYPPQFPHQNIGNYASDFQQPKLVKKCYNCDQDGHLIKHCPYPKTSRGTKQ